MATPGVGGKRTCICHNIAYMCNLGTKRSKFQWNILGTRIVYIRPKGRTQCIFPRSQHSCLYVYIDQK